MFSQELRRPLTHKTDSQAEDHALQRQLSRLLDFGKQVLGGLVPNPFEGQRLGFVQLVDVGDVFDQPAVGQLVDQGLAHAFNIHHRAGGEVKNGFPQFGRTGRIDTTMIGLALHAHHVAAALGATLRHLEGLVAARVILVVDDFNDFRNYVAAALDQDPISDFDPQALDLILVVQGSTADCGSADRNRLQRSDGGELPRAPHADQDVFDLGNPAARRVFVSDSPARRFSGKAQALLQANRVDFDDDAVNLVG